MRLSTQLKINDRNMANVSKLKFQQSNIKCIRTFKSWYYEFLKKSERFEISLDKEVAEMYYKGGYSPRMVIHEVLRIPVEINVC